MGQRVSWDQAYYGSGVDARQIVISMQGSNPGADPLRDVLTRYGSGETQQASVPQPPPGYAPPSGAVPLQPGTMAPAQSGARGPVQQQSLPPPR